MIDTPERGPSGFCTLHHQWEDLLFLHWQCDPAAIQATLPHGLQVDTFGGAAYVGVVPFFMRNIRPAFVPALPWISHFLELNVRTYVRDEMGRSGVWFYSLECNQPVAVTCARASLGLNYVHARMSAQRGEWVEYTCTRRGKPVAAQYRYRAVGPEACAPDASLEYYLLERYYLYSRWLGRLIRCGISHRAYVYRAAEAPEYSLIPATEWNGLSFLSGPPVHACHVQTLRVETRFPEIVA